MNKFNLGDIVVTWWDDTECLVVERGKDYCKVKVINGEFDGVTFISWCPYKFKKIGNILDGARKIV